MMLRYNNHNQVGFSKPVDYFRPLTVDVSVEYELPKEVAPPPGSAPLLIIHPSAYYRSSSHSKPDSILSPRPTNTNKASNTTSNSSYYLRSSSNGNNNSGNTGATGSGLQSNPIYPISSSHHHAGSRHGISTKSVRYVSSGDDGTNGSNNIAMNSASISRSRSMTMGAGDSRSHSHSGGSIPGNCPYGKCDECASGGGCGTNSTSNTPHSSRVTSGGVKKSTFHQSRQQQSQQDGLTLGDPFNYYQLQQPHHQSHNTSSSSNNSANSSNNTNTTPIRRTSRSNLHLLQQQHQHQQNNSNNGLRSSSTGTSSSANGMVNCGVGGSGNGSSNSITNIGNNNRSSSTSNNATRSSIINNTSSSNSNSTSNKRLRMMSQQQNSSSQHQPLTTEPLNLAVLAPSIGASGNSHLQHHLSPSTMYLDQRSSLYKQHNQQNLHLQQQHQQQNRNSSAGLIGNGVVGGGGPAGINVVNNGLVLPNVANSIHQMINTYGGGGGYYRAPNLSALNNLFNSSSNSSTQSANRFLRECPIPVDKGSGSDSGVCSENDCDSSPTMDSYHSNSNNLSTTNNSRRSILSQSQEIPSSGYYCLCCPTSSISSSSRSKSIGGKVKSSSGKSSRSGSGENIRTSTKSNNSNSSVSVTNYSGGGDGVSGGIGSAYATMVIHESQLSNMLDSYEYDYPMVSESFSPMDSSSCPATYRKYFGVGVGSVIGNNITSASTTSSGRWFQV